MTHPDLANIQSVIFLFEFQLAVFKVIHLKVGGFQSVFTDDDLASSRIGSNLAAMLTESPKAVISVMLPLLLTEPTKTLPKYSDIK